MSSFKRHGAAAAAVLPAGVRPSSFSSPVPLISTGVSALDDILSGGGLSSGSVLAILPATGTAAQSAAQLGASSSSPSSAAETDHVARSAAEPYVELLLAYSVAQGIAAQHRGVIIGEAGSAFVQGLMARAGDLDEQQLAALSSPESATPADDTQSGPSDQLDTVPDDGDDEGDDSNLGKAPVSAQREREMKIAWRYERMKQFSTTVSSGSTKSAEAEQPFCNTFDLSKHISPRLLQKARDDGNLEIADVDNFPSSSNAYDQAYEQIEAAAQTCRQQAQAARAAGGPSTPAKAQPVLRISIRALGSPSWRVARGQRVEVEVIRFLRRVKCLVRDLALPNDAGSPAVPAVAVITLSASLLSSLSAGPAGSCCSNLPHRLAHTVDAAISLSAFAPSPSLRTAFSAYTGALKVLKTPAIGTLTNPSIRASVLRGMGAGAASPSQSRGGAGDSANTVGEGGAGGGENNLAFKVRRKRLVIETLHLDVEGGVSERRTKPPKNADADTRKPSTPETPKPPSGSEVSAARPRPPRSPEGSQKPAPLLSAPKPKFGGLSSLRQRGIAAANASSSAAGPNQTSAAPQAGLEVELDTRAAHSHPHAHSHARSQRPHPSKQFTSSRAEDYDF